MPSSRRTYLAGVGVGLSTIIAGCSDESRPTSTPIASNWEQIGHDSRHTSANTSISNISQGDTHWRTELEANAEISGVAVIDNRIIAGGRREMERGFLSQISLGDGEILSSVELSTPVIAPPVLSENSVITTCRIDGQTGSLRSFDYEETERWSHRVAGTLPAPPAIHQSVVYGGSRKGEIFALEESDGDVRWERTLGDEQTEGAVSAPPTVDETGVYIPLSSSAAQGIYSLSPTDGTTKWKIEGPRILSILARTDDVLLVSYPSYDVAAFDIRTGERRWSTSLAEKEVSPPAVSDGIVVVADETTLYGLEAETGEERWSITCDPDTAYQPVIAGPTVLIQSENSLICCSVEDGEQLWTSDHSSGIPIVPFENGLLFSPAPNTLAAYSSYQE